MKLVWSPEMAAKAFMDTVRSCEVYQGSSVTELISAMAAGWDAKLIVETWSLGRVITTSIGLAIASTHTCGRHVCIVPDIVSRTEYMTTMKKYQMLPEVIIGDVEMVVKELEFIDFLVVDSRNNEFDRVIKAAKFSDHGAVLVCKNASSRAATDVRLRSLFDDDGSRRIVRSVFLPVGNWLDIAHVGAAGSGSGSASGSGSGKVEKNRWIRRVDRQSGEEIFIRK